MSYQDDLEAELIARMAIDYEQDPDRVISAAAKVELDPGLFMWVDLERQKLNRASGRG